MKKEIKKLIVKTIIVTIILVGLVTILPAATKQAPQNSQVSNNDGFDSQPDGNSMVFVIDWKKLKKPKKSDIPRITSNTDVSITVKNFNFFQYSLKYTVDEEVIESYKAIETLWAEIFGLTLLPPSPESIAPGLPVEPQEDKIFTWRKKLYETKISFSKILKWINGNADKPRGGVGNDNTAIDLDKKFTFYIPTNPEDSDKKPKKGEASILDTIAESISVHFEIPTEVEKDKIKKAFSFIKFVEKEKKDQNKDGDNKKVRYYGVIRGTYEFSFTQVLEYIKKMFVLLEGKINEKPSILLEEVNSHDELNRYEKVLSYHHQIIDKINTFKAAAALTLNGYTEHIGKRKSGSFITVNITPIDKSKSNLLVNQKKNGFSYFVHSSFPVVFHVGYAYSTLKDVKFEKVRSLESSDLYSKVKDEKGIDEFVAYLSWEIPKIFSKNPRYSLALTLGTDFSSPGDKIYAGATLKLFSRVFITTGIASGEVAEADENNKIADKIVDEVTGKANVRNLYTTINMRRDWKWFIGISFSFL